MKKPSFEAQADAFIKKATHGRDKLKQVENSDAKKKVKKSVIITEFKPHIFTDPNYNCISCMGEGLENGLNPNRVCPVCNGTGKQNV